ncbi:hypothetical protein PR048_013479 [Dryococelus australis]|uniref:Uncharacterized protein n=1 Tax=Dryococelus australis TaxID=614101 RepID=A0ABQ9HSA9_9NEOP|nr:hypothetical protein PR048_013479 [Dryococelus australis]
MVQNFFGYDEFSRLGPGKMDSIPVRISGITTYKQKRLLLCNLREMYVHYCNQNGPEIGFSKFCELRPKWCIGVRSAGMHAVCVSTLHQNKKLLLSAIAISDYKEFLSKAMNNVLDQKVWNQQLSAILKTVIQKN